MVSKLSSATKSVTLSGVGSSVAKRFVSARYTIRDTKLFPWHDCLLTRLEPRSVLAANDVRAHYRSPTTSTFPPTLRCYHTGWGEITGV